MFDIFWSKCRHIQSINFHSAQSDAFVSRKNWVGFLAACYIIPHNKNYNYNFHPNVSIGGTRQKQTGKQVCLPTAFRQPLTADLDCAKLITNAIGVFITADMQPYLVIENKGFKHMVKSHVCILVSPLCLPCIKERKRQSYDGALLTFVLFLCSYWQNAQTCSYSQVVKKQRFVTPLGICMRCTGLSINSNVKTSVAILDAQRNCSGHPFTPILTWPRRYTMLWASVPLENRGPAAQKCFPHC